MTNLERAVIIAARAYRQARLIHGRAALYGDQAATLNAAYQVNLRAHELLVAADQLALPEDVVS